MKKENAVPNKSSKEGQSKKTQKLEEIIKETTALLRSAKLYRTTRLLLCATMIVTIYLFALISLDFITVQFQELQGIVAWYPRAGITYVLFLAFRAGFTPVVTLVLLISIIFIYRMHQHPHMNGETVKLSDLLSFPCPIQTVIGQASVLAFIRKRTVDCSPVVLL